MTREERDKVIKILQWLHDNNFLFRSTEEDIKYATKLAIQALEQEPILDKIKAEIEDLDVFYDSDYFSSNEDAMYKCKEILEIIDKYRVQSEDKK